MIIKKNKNGIIKNTIFLLTIFVVVFSFFGSSIYSVFADNHIWTERTGSGSRTWLGIASSSDGTKLVAVAGPLEDIYTSTDSGVTWTPHTVGLFENFKSVTSSSDGVNLAAAVQGGKIWTSSDSGSNWAEEAGSPSAGWLKIVSSSDGSKLAAVNPWSNVYTSDDYGVSWDLQTLSPGLDLSSVTSSSDGSKLAATVSGGYIYTSTDSGVNWTEQTGSGSRDWRSVASSSDGSKLAAVSSGGYIYTSTDSGVTWEEETTATSSNWTSIASSSDGTKLAATPGSGNIFTAAPDVTNPTISGLLPSDNSTGASVSDDLVITFDEIVDVESGFITIYKGLDVVESIDVTSGQVTGTGTDTITINPTSDLPSFSSLYVQIDASAFDDPSGNSFAGILDTTTWNFVTIDSENPYIVSVSPADNSNSVSLDSDLVITFNEIVGIHDGFTPGVLTIMRTADNSQFEQFLDDSVLITGAGTNTITINPTLDLEENTEYYININSELVEDTSANLFVGIFDTTTWNFSTTVPPSGGGGGSSPDKACEDGLDNDGDSFVDFPDDLGCSETRDTDEFNEIVTPIDPCILNPSSCIPPPPVETCLTNPSLCVPPPIETDPCILNPSSCVNPPPIDPCTLAGSNCNPPVDDDDPTIDPPIEDCGDNCTTPQDDPIDPIFNDGGSCPGGILNSAGCIIKDSLDNVEQAVRDLSSQVKEIANSNYGNVLIKTISITGLVFGTIFTVLPTLFANPLSFSEIALIPMRLWSLLMTLFGIKKKTRKWGVVYDSVTKQPLDPVYVTLQDIEGKEIMSSLTDIDGRYGFLVEPGKYRLLPKKTNYTFPSLKVVGKTRDEIYLDLYFGYVFEVSQSGEVISKNIPMDPVNFDWNEFAKKEKELTKFYSKRDIIFSKIADITFSIGITLAFIALVSAPVNYNIAIFILYLIILVFREFGIRQKKSSKVMRKGTDIPLAFAIVRIFDTATNIEILHKVTNKIGKFFALVRNGKYYVTIESKNEDGTYTKVYTSESIEVKDGIIDQKFEV